MSDQRGNPYRAANDYPEGIPTNRPIVPNVLRGPYGADPVALPSQVGVRPDARLATSLLTQAFGWMFGGLLVTAVVAGLVQADVRLVSLARSLFLPAILGQLALVVVLSAGIRRMNATLALGLFFVYAATVGLTFGLVATAYRVESIAAAFVSASAMFGGAAIYGATTRRSLATLGGYLFMGLLGLIVAMIVNAFIGSGPVGFAISLVGVVIFTALTAYDTQRIASGDVAAIAGSMEKAAVIGALRLYLDFINLFLMLLRLFGSRR